MTSARKELYVVLGTITFALLIGLIGVVKIQKMEERDRAKYAEQAKVQVVFGDYAKLTRIACDEKRFWTECGVTYPDFFLRRSLIRIKQVMYRADVSGEIIQLNVPYCVIATDKAEFAVLEECWRIL